MDRQLLQKRSGAIALFIVFGFPALAQAEVKFSFQTIDVPGATRTAVNGNGPNAIVGEYDDIHGKTHGFILRGGVFTTIDRKPDAILTSLNGVNANGDIVGTYTDSGPDLLRHAFFLRNGVFTDLDPITPHIRSQGGFLNAKDEVVGAYRTPGPPGHPADQKRHGFLWRNGVFASINIPNDNPVGGTVAFGINDHGQIVGNYVDNATPQPVRHGFLLNKGVVTTLDPPGAGGVTTAQGVNNAGVVVGGYFDTQGNLHGFVWVNGSYTKVDAPNSTGTVINSINAQGAIAGAYDVGDVTHGFTATPIR